MATVNITVTPTYDIGNLMELYLKLVFLFIFATKMGLLGLSQCVFIFNIY